MTTFEPDFAEILPFAQAQLEQARANDLALNPGPLPLPDLTEQTADALDAVTTPTSPAEKFLAMVPRQPEAAVPAPVPDCGDPECFDGWVDSPEGARRCPRCAAQAQTLKLAEQYARAGVEGSLYHLTWEDVRLRHESWRLVRALGRSIRDVMRDCLSVAMVGERGRGKTQAGVLLAKDAIEAGYSALVTDWAEWVDEVQSDYTRRVKTQAEHVTALTTPDLLVLDDVGAAASAAGDLERKLFTRVIGARYNRRKPTIITANLSRSELQAAMGERAFDRIEHACAWVVFNGPSERAEVERNRVQDTLERIRREAGL